MPDGQSMALESIKRHLLRRKEMLDAAAGDFDWVFSDPVAAYLAPALSFLARDGLLEIDAAAVQKSRVLYYQNEARWALWLPVFQHVLNVLHAHEIEVMALKAFAHQGSLYPAAGLRAFNDIDVVVKPAKFLTAVQVLVDDGFILLEETFTTLATAPQKVTEVSLKSPEGVVIEIHQSILPVKNFFRYESAYNLAEESLWSRAEKSSGEPDGAYRLSLLDTLAHLCLHAATHGLSAGASFTYLDLDAWLRKEKARIDWTEFVRLTSAWKIKSAAYHTFQLCRRNYDTPIPDAVFAELDPGFWAKWRLARVYSAESTLANDRRKIGIRKPKFVRLMIFDRFTDLLRILFGGFFPTRKLRWIVYGKKVSLIAHWLIIFRKFGLEI